MERPDAEQQALKARHLLAGRFHGVLSTVSADKPDQPFGSVVPYCLGLDGVPVFLLSHLAQHTKNLLANPRAALTVLEAFEGDVQQAARLTGTGEVLSLEDSGDAAARYFRCFPQSRMYFESLGFRFFRMHPGRWHFNSGFATARWLGNDRVIRANPFSAHVEEGVVAHMNAGHRDALQGYLAQAGRGLPMEEEVRLCGVDGEGMDLAVGDRLERIAFPRAVDSPEALRAVLVEMASP